MTLVILLNVSADLNKIDRYKQWMDLIPPPTTKGKLDTFLFDHFGVEPSTIHGLYGRKFVISMVARCYSPGCLAKNVLVLEGKQSAG